MITLAGLLRAAETEKARYEELIKLFPPGTVNDARNDAYRAYHTAMVCAKYMAEHGKEQMLNVGPYHAFKPARGQRVRVVKGALVHSTHPQSPEGGKTLKRSQVVTVHRFDHGYVADEKVYAGQITWAGSGGYWCWTSLDNIEPLEQEAAQLNTLEKASITPA